MNVCDWNSTTSLQTVLFTLTLCFNTFHRSATYLEAYYRYAYVNKLVKDFSKNISPVIEADQKKVRISATVKGCYQHVHISTIKIRQTFISVWRHKAKEIIFRSMSSPLCCNDDMCKHMKMLVLTKMKCLNFFYYKLYHYRDAMD